MTRFNNKYPYTDFHELNADWLLETVKDAEAEAKEAAETVETYNDRLTTVEGNLAPIKAAMPGIASSISDLTSGLGRVSSQVTTNTQDIADNATNIDNIEERLTTYDQNFIDINHQFISDQGRIRDLEAYRTEAQVKIGSLGYSIAPLFDETAGYNAGDYVMSPTLKLHRAIVDIPAGTANINDLTQFRPTDIVDNMGGGGVQQTITDALQVNTTYVPQSNIHVKVAKTGQVVTVSGYFRNEYNGLTGNILDLVYKPISAIHNIQIGWGTSGGSMTAYLDTDGILKTYTTSYDSDNYYFSFSYITND